MVLLELRQVYQDNKVPKSLRKVNLKVLQFDKLVKSNKKDTKHFDIPFDTPNISGRKDLDLGFG